MNYFQLYNSFLPPLKKEIIFKLNIYFSLLVEEAQIRGFVAKSSEDTLWVRHILDSLLVLQTGINFKGFVLDMGTGAGLPGVVLAICCPKVNFTLVDSSLKKINFLKEVKKKINIKNCIPIIFKLFKNE